MFKGEFHRFFRCKEGQITLNDVLVRIVYNGGDRNQTSVEFNVSKRSLAMLFFQIYHYFTINITYKTQKTHVS